MTSSESAAHRPQRAGRTGATGAPGDPADAPSVRPKSRPANLRRSPLLFRIAMILFCIGGIALLMVAVLFASGVRHFQAWVWVLVALAPIGLVVGAFGVGRAGRALDT